MNKRYFRCKDITTAEGAKYITCVISIPEIESSGNGPLDRQTLRENVITALEDTLSVEVDSYSGMEELSWA